MARPLWSSEPEEEKALLVGIQLRGRTQADVGDSLDELHLLSETGGAVVAGRLVCRQPSVHPATYIGKGKAAEIAAQVAEQGLTTVVFDDDLSAAQGRNLSEIIGCKIIDRTQLILDIFAQHARTKEGRLQIELAQLEYLLPRLRRMWTHLERQRGGIGLRGPGEQQLELDRRKIEDRMARISLALEDVRARRSEQRRGRRRHGWALITLVGYTNAGKSTLLNGLTGAEVEADDRLFATLDPTTRQIRLPNHQPALMTDTVGFIRKLPHHLVDSFRATLEEVNEADLLLHVIDASHPQVDQQIEAVHSVLRDLGAAEKPILSVLNKMDLPAAQLHSMRLAEKVGGRVVEISALTGKGLEPLRVELADMLKSRNVRVHLRIPMSEGKLLAAIRSVGRMYIEKYDDDETVEIDAAVPGSLLGACVKYDVDAGGKGGEGEGKHGEG